MKKFGRFYVNMGDFRHIWRKITKKMEFLLLRCVIGATHRCEIFKIWSCGMSLVPHTPCEIFKVSDVVWHGSHIKICHNHSHWSVVWVSFRYLLCHTILYSKECWHQQRRFSALRLLLVPTQGKRMLSKYNRNWFFLLILLCGLVTHLVGWPELW